MKECYKDFIVGFVVVVLGSGLIALFCIKPEILIKLILLGILIGLLYLCYVLGKNIRESEWYEDLVSYVKRMLNNQRKKGG